MNHAPVIAVFAFSLLALVGVGVILSRDVSDSAESDNSPVNLGDVAEPTTSQVQPIGRGIDYEAEIRANPSATVFTERGETWYTLGEYERALADFHEAVRLAPTSSIAHDNRGLAFHKTKQVLPALDDFTKAILLNHRNVAALVHASWLLTTCTDGKVRDANLAKSFATTACELTEWKDASSLSALAAAC